MFEECCSYGESDRDLTRENCQLFLDKYSSKTDGDVEAILQLSHLRCSLAILQMDSADSDFSLLNFKEAIRLAQGPPRGGTGLGASEALTNAEYRACLAMANHLAETNQISEAVTLLVEVLNKVKRGGYQFWEGVALSLIGKIYGWQKKFEQAESKLKTAVAILVNHKHTKEGNMHYRRGLATLQELFGIQNKVGEAEAIRHDHFQETHCNT